MCANYWNKPLNPYYARTASACCFQHESCLFWALCARVLGKWINWKRHLQGSLISLKQSFKGRAVTCHNQMLLRKISPPIPQSVTCFFTSLLKASVIAHLLFAQESAMYPSEACMSFMQLPLLTDLICFWLNLLERIGYLQGDVNGKLEKKMEF